MKLQRTEQTSFATFGQFVRDDGQIVCVTLERPWLNNQHGVSCIPAGSYTAYRFDSPHIGYQLFQVRDVPDRQGIDIHVGNLPKDTAGCILLGLARGDVLDTTDGQTKPGIIQSHDAFGHFMALLIGIDSFPLEVADVPGVVA